MVSVRTRRLLLWVALPALLLILLYTILGFYLVPRLIRSGADDFVTRNYHRKLAIGEIRFNPYSLRLDVRDFSLPDSDGKPMVSFAHLVVDLTVASVWHLGPDFESILLEQPFARVMIKKDGTLNLSELALPPSPQARPQAESGPVRLFINHFRVQRGNVAFEDLAHPSAFRTEIQPITFDLRNFSTVGKQGGTYSLSGASDAGETFRWSGSLKGNPLASHGEFAVGNLQAQTIWNYLRDSVQFELPTGTLSIAGDYDFTTATSPVGLGVDVHTITVKDLGIRPRGGKDDYIRLARLEIQETRADVSKHTVDIGSVHLSGGELRAWMPGAGGAKLNLMELSGSPKVAAPTPATATTAPADSAAEPAPATAPDSPHEATPSWTVSVPNIALDNFKLSVEDRSVSPAVPLLLDELGVHVNGFSTAHSNPVAATLSTRINRDGQLDVKADLSPDLASAKAQIELAHFDLSMLQPYVAQKTAMTLRSGQLGTRLNVDRGADGRVAVTGEVDLTKFRSVDNELKRDFIKFERVQATGIDFQMPPQEPSKPANMKLHIRSVVARAPYARVIIEPDRTTNVSRVLSGPGGLPPEKPDKGPASADTALQVASAPDSPDAHAAIAVGGGAIVAPATPSPSGASATASRGRHSRPPPASEGPLSLAIDEITIQDGSANYADLWIQPNFAVGIQTLNGHIKGLSSSPRARAKVELDGKVDRYAPVRIWGETNPLAATAYTDIRMTFKGVEMTSATPYSGHFAGYKIEKGKLSVDIEYKIDNRQLNAAHKVVIDQLELGERVESPDAVHLPLKIAVALLKDRNGVIDLDLPVTGSLDDPKFKLGPLIWKAVLNLLTKIATAPFALLGHLFGGGEQMNFIDFHPGSAVLEQSEHDKLLALVKALKEKEKLELDVPITYSPDLDRPGLAAAHLNLQLAELNAGATGGRRKGKAVASPAAPGAPAPSAAIGKSASELAATAGPPGTEATPRASELMDVPPSDDPALNDPARRHRLLVDLFHAQMGKQAALPDLSREIEESGRKKDSPPDFSAANSELEAALLQKIQVPDSELETLGKHRARAIQDVLLQGTEIDPARVFIIGSAPKNAPEKDKVRVELALK